MSDGAETAAYMARDATMDLRARVDEMARNLAIALARIERLEEALRAKTDG